MATIKGSLANRLRKNLRWSEARQKRLMKNFEKRFQEMEERIEFLEAAVISKTNTTNSSKTKQKNLKLQAVDDIMEGLASRDVVPFLYAICSGVVGAISVLLAKCLAIMVKLTINGDNQFKYPTTFGFLVGMTFALLLQTHLLNMATTLGDTMTVFPIFQSFWISFSVIGGIVFYERDEVFKTSEWLLYAVALLFVAIGVASLTRHEVKKRATLQGVKTSSFEMPIDDLKMMIEEATEGGDSITAPLLFRS